MFKHKKVLICGMALSGQSAALLLSEQGAFVTATDTNSNIRLAFDPVALGVTCRFGENPETFIDDFELIIISPGISVYAPFVQKAIALGIPVWSEAELAARLCPCPIIAITGTNGKTTVTSIVGEIMKICKPGTQVAGNIGIPLTSLLSKLTAEDVLVAEISSFQLETIHEFRPFISAILNITPDHLDRHGSMEVYIEAKKRIYENQRQSEFVVLNYDNPVTKLLTPSAKTVFFSQNKELAEGVFIKDEWVFARLRGNSTAVVPVKDCKTIAENALAATAISLLADAPPEVIRHVLENFKGVPHRLEYVATINGVAFYNDSKATNVAAAIKALESFDRPVVLIAGGYDKDADFAGWVRLFNKKTSDVILIGQTAEQIAKDCDMAGFSSYSFASTLKEAVGIAYKKASPSRAVLLSPACASFGSFSGFEERGEKFKEYIYKLK